MERSSWLTSRIAMFCYGVTVVMASVLVGALFVAPLFAPKTQFAAINVDSDNVAIHGYDTVAYFTENKPMKGQPKFEHQWNDARWHFASVNNRDLFRANPERYAPQFGGYCAGGLAAGEFADGDPSNWTIVDGKLYLNKNKELRDIWRKATEAYIVYGEYNWNNNRDQLRNNY